MKRIIALLFTLSVILWFFSAQAELSDIEITDILTYSQYCKYKELYEPDMKSRDTYGKYRVKIEVVIGLIFDDDDWEETYDFTMWIKDEDGYYPDERHVSPGSKLDSFPFRPKCGQRIILELYPSDYGMIYGGGIQNWEIIEENVDVVSIAKEYAEKKTIPYEDIKRYKELYEPDMEEYEYIADSRMIYIESIIGTDYSQGDYYSSFDLWIKGREGYYRTTVENFHFSKKPEYGQRIIFGITVNYNGSWIKFWDYEVLVIEEGVDVSTIESDGIETDPIVALLKKPFDDKSFSNDYSYKKILRNPDSYEYSPIVFTAKYRQECNYVDYLVQDSDDNYFMLLINDGILDFNLLIDDNIMVYGYINGTYKYNTLVGKKTVPYILVKKIILLDDE